MDSSQTKNESTMKEAEEEVVTQLYSMLKVWHTQLLVPLKIITEAYMTGEAFNRVLGDNNNNYHISKLLSS
jgi:hypothetical protein